MTNVERHECRKWRLSKLLSRQIDESEALFGKLRKTALMRSLLDSLSLPQSIEDRALLRQSFVNRDGVTVISFLNQHGFNRAWDDPYFRNCLQGSDILLRDGVGITVCLALLGIRPGLNMNGTDFIPEILQEFPPQSSLALFGTREPWLSTAATKLDELGFRVTLKEHGFHDASHYIKQLGEDPPAVILLGMGMPKQEELALNIKRCFSKRNIIVINGGAVIDFLGGRFPRAPKTLRYARLEWLFRLSLEPRRLFSRYVSGGFSFIYRVLRMARRRFRTPAIFQH
jgi:exopolysaccharide biosynthesis WecB/TagA/CpsF family protein